MKKFITMILAIMLVMSMIPNCAYAQSYEEAEENEVIIDELLCEDFRYDKDTNLWIFEGKEEDIDGIMEMSATYNLYYNNGHIEFKYYIYGDTEAELKYAADGYIDFKWYPKDEEFGITSMKINEYEEIESMIEIF